MKIYYCLLLLLFLTIMKRNAAVAVAAAMALRAVTADTRLDCVPPNIVHECKIVHNPSPLY